MTLAVLSLACCSLVPVFHRILGRVSRLHGARVGSGGHIRVRTGWGKGTQPHAVAPKALGRVYDAF